MNRSFERDIIPMARSEGRPGMYSPSAALTHVIRTGLALAPYSVLAGGKLRTDEEEERRRQTGEKGRTMVNPHWERNETEKAMSAALEKVAIEVGAKHITAVAIAYLMQKVPYVFPIIGGRKVEQLEANLESLTITLTVEQMQYLECRSFRSRLPPYHDRELSAQWRFADVDILYRGRWHRIQLPVAKCCVSREATAAAAHNP